MLDPKFKMAYPSIPSKWFWFYKKIFSSDYSRNGEMSKYLGISNLLCEFARKFSENHAIFMSFLTVSLTEWKVVKGILNYKILLKKVLYIYCCFIILKFVAKCKERLEYWRDSWKTCLVDCECDLINHCFTT